MTHLEEQVIRRSDVNLAELRADAARGVASQAIADLNRERALADRLANALRYYRDAARKER